MKKRSLFVSILILVFGLFTALSFFDVNSEKNNLVYAETSSVSEWNGITPTSEWDGVSQISETQVTSADFYSNNSNEVRIRSAAGLAYFAHTINTYSGSKTYQNYTIYLETDIDLKNYAWTPIGVNSFFEGTFDGQCHTITNIKIAADGPYAGFFGMVVGNIRNLNLENITYASVAQYVGGLAAQFSYISNPNTIENCSVDKITYTGGTSVTHFGGLVGFANTADATISKSRVLRLNVSSSTANIGGLVGTSVANIHECYTEGSFAVSGTGVYVGGLVGSVGKGVSGSFNPEIYDSFSTVGIKLSAKEITAGGLVGVVDNILKNTFKYVLHTSYFAGSISGTSSSIGMNATIGGLVGVINATNAQLTDCFALATLPANKTLYTTTKTPKVTKCYDNIETSGSRYVKELKDFAYIEGFYGSDRYWTGERIDSGVAGFKTYKTLWNFDTIWGIEFGINGGLPYLRNTNIFSNNHDTYYSAKTEMGLDVLKGEGTVDNPYKIFTAADLGYVSFYYNELNYEAQKVKSGAKVYYALQNDIDLTGKTWMPIGIFAETKPFQDVFDGNGFAISGLTCSQHESFSHYGLFGKTSNGAVIKNLTMRNVIYLTSPTSNAVGKGTFVGSVAGETYIINCRDENCASATDSANPSIGTAVTNKKLFIVAGENSHNINLSNLKPNQYERLYQVEIDSAGGIFYSSTVASKQATNRVNKGIYKLVLTSDGKIYQDAKKNPIKIDETYNTMLPTTSDNEEYAKSYLDLLIKKGFKLAGYQVASVTNGQVVSLSNVIVDNVTDALATLETGATTIRLVALWNDMGFYNTSTAVKVKIIYNDYERDNFFAEYVADTTWHVSKNPQGKPVVYIDYNLEYDSVLEEDYPELFNTPYVIKNGSRVYMRSNDFEVAEIWTTYSASKFSNAVSRGQFANSRIDNAQWHASWKAATSKITGNALPTTYNFTVKFKQLVHEDTYNDYRDYAGDFELADAIESITYRRSAQDFKVETVVEFSEMTNGSFTFSYDTTNSVDKTQYIMLKVNLKEGYSFPGAVSFGDLQSGKKNTNFGILTVGNADKGATGYFSAQKKTLATEGVLFYNLIGNYTLNLTVQRDLVQHVVEAGLYHAFAPNLTDVQNVYAYAVVDNAEVQYELKINGKGLQGLHVGLDVKNKAIISSDPEFGVMKLVTNSSGGWSYMDGGKEVKLVFNQTSPSGFSMYLRYVTAAGDRFFEYRYQVMAKEYKNEEKLYIYEISALPQYGDYDTDETRIDYILNFNLNLNYLTWAEETVEHYTDTDFVFLASTEDSAIVFNDYVTQAGWDDYFPDEIKVGGEGGVTHTPLIEAEGAGGIKQPRKFVVEFVRVGHGYSSNYYEIKAVEKYTEASFRIKIVDSNGNMIIPGESPTSEFMHVAIPKYLITEDGTVTFKIATTPYYTIRNVFNASGAPQLIFATSATDASELYNIHINPKKVSLDKGIGESDESYQQRCKDYMNALAQDNTRYFTREGRGPSISVTNDTFEIALPYNRATNAVGLQPGNYEITITCEIVYYKLEYGTRFLSYQDRDVLESELTLDNTGDGVYLAEEENSQITTHALREETDYDSAVQNIQYDDRMFLSTQLGSNQAYFFKGWYIEAYNYQGYIRIGPDLFTAESFDFFYSDYYVDPAIVPEEYNTRYQTRIYAVYIKKQVTLTVYDYGILLDENGVDGVDVEKYLFEFEIMDLQFKIGETTPLTEQIYSYSSNAEEPLLLNGLAFVKNSGFGYYFDGYELVNEAGRVLQTIEGALIFDLHDYVKEMLENPIEGEQYINERRLYLKPLLRQKTARIFIYSGTGTATSYGDFKDNGIVYDYNGNETTDDVYEIVQMFYSQTVTFDSTEGYEFLLNGEETDLSANAAFASRKGYQLEPMKPWTVVEGNKGSLDGSYLELNSNYFTEETAEVNYIEVHIYRAWKANEYTLVFRRGTGTFTPNTDDESVTVRVVYDQEYGSDCQLLSGVPTLRKIKYTGYTLVGWNYTHFDGTTVTTEFDAAGLFIGSTLFDEKGRYILEDPETGLPADMVYLLPEWGSGVYTIHIYTNGADTVNGIAVSGDKKENYLEYNINYNKTFAQMYVGSNDLEYVDLSSIVLTRKGFHFLNFSIKDGNYIAEITRDHIFDEFLRGMSLTRTPALTIYAQWSFDQESLQLELNDSYLPALKYNGQNQMVYLADYFYEGNYTAVGFNIDTGSNVLDIALKDANLTSLTIRFESLNAAKDQGQMAFSVKDCLTAGAYTATLYLSVDDEAKYLSLGTVWSAAINFNITVDVAEIEIDDSVTSEEVYVANIKRILAPYISATQKSNLESRVSLATVATFVRGLESGLDALSDIQVYEYTMVKYYFISITNDASVLIYKNWTYQDYLDLRTSNEELADVIINQMKYFDFYQYANNSGKQEIASYKSLTLKSPTVSNVSSDLEVVSLEINSPEILAQTLYTARVYVRSLGLGRGVTNYNLSYDEATGRYYIEGLQVFILPQVLVVENRQVEKSSYYNAYQTPEIEWQGSREYVDFEGQLHYLIEGNIYVAATLTTSTVGNKDGDTQFNFVDPTNYLYFVETSIVRKVGEDLIRSLSDFKLVMSESDIYTILNVNGIVDVIIDARYLTRNEGLLSFEQVDNALATKLLKIVSVTYTQGGKETTIREENGLAERAYSDGGAYFEIYTNNENMVYARINPAVTSITVIAAEINLSEYISLYKWSQYAEFDVDGTMASDGAYTINRSDIEISEDSLTEVTYYAIYTDLVKTVYHYGFPEGFGLDTTAEGVLKLGSSTAEDVKQPSVAGFQLIELQAERLDGSRVNYANIFTGAIGAGGGKTFVGLSSSAKFVTVNFYALWKAEEMQTYQILTTKKYPVEQFLGLNQEEVVGFDNKNTLIFTYTYKWMFEGELVKEGEVLQLAGNGTFNQTGNYSLVVTCSIIEEFKSALYDPGTGGTTTATINFYLEFVRNKIIAIQFPDEVTSVYNGQDQANQWGIEVTFTQYNASTDDYKIVYSTTTLHNSTVGTLYTQMYFNGGSDPVAEMKNAGYYIIEVCYSPASYILEDGLAQTTFVYTITPFVADIAELNVGFTKKFNTADPVLKVDTIFTAEMVTLLFARPLGEDVGIYNLYFEDIAQDYKGNYVFKMGGTTLFENGTKTVDCSTTAVGEFEIQKTGALKFAYETSAVNPAHIVRGYSNKGYTFTVNSDFVMQILSDGNVLHTFNLKLYDVSTNLEITNLEIKNLIRAQMGDVTPKFYATDLLDIVYESAVYTYRFEIGEQMSRYFASVEFDQNYAFEVGQIQIDVSAIDFNKVYDAQTTATFDQLGNAVDLDEYVGMYILATYATSHAGENVKVELSLNNNDPTTNLGNYALAATSTTATILKRSATLTVSMTSANYVYGDISLRNIVDKVASIEVVDTEGNDVRSWLIDGYYNIRYGLADDVKINGSGYVYKGNYTLQITSTFDDFNMTVVSPSFTIDAMEIELALGQGYISVTAVEKIKAAYEDVYSVGSTGDFLDISYRVVGQTVGANAQVGLWDLALNQSSFLEGSVVLLLPAGNEAFEVILATNILYLRLDPAQTSLLTKQYISSNYALSADGANKQLLITSVVTQTIDMKFFMLEDENEVAINSADVSFDSIEITATGGVFSFQNAGSYRLVLKAEASGYETVVFDREYYFIIEKQMINVDNLTLEKEYSGDSVGIIENFAEKLGSDNVSILVRYKTAEVGEDIEVSLFLQGAQAPNYQLSIEKSVGKITKASAVLSLTQTSWVYGMINSSNLFGHQLLVNGNIVTTSQYTIAFTVVDGRYSDFGYLNVGSYNIEATIVSNSYQITYVPTLVQITPYELDIEFLTNGLATYSYGAPETLTDEFAFEYQTQLFEDVTLILTRESGFAVGNYHVIDGRLDGSETNYTLLSLVDNSSEGMFRILKAIETVYLLLSNDETVTLGGTTATIEYDGNAYDSVAVEERSAGLYKLVIYNSKNKGVKREFDLNAYSLSNGTYTKIAGQIENLTAQVQFLNASNVKNIGTYEIFAGDITANNYNVMLGQNGAQYAYFFRILAKKLYFKQRLVSKVFDNKSALFVYENAADMLDGVVEGEDIVLTIRLLDAGGMIVKYAGFDYTVDATIAGDTIGNYDFARKTTLDGTPITGRIERAEIFIVLNTQKFKYGDDIDLKYSYRTDVDMTGYDMTRMSIAVNPAADAANYSSTGCLNAGEYAAVVTYSFEDFFCDKFIVDNAEQPSTTGASFVVEKVELTLVTMSNLSFQEIFTKTYDETVDVELVRDGAEVLGITGIITKGGVYDDVAIVSATYARETIGEGIVVTINIDGVDSQNYTIATWNHGVINPVIVFIEFDDNTEEETRSDVIINGLVEISELAYPFVSASNITSNSANTQTSTNKNFPTMLTGKTGHSFSHWVMIFKNIATETEEYTFLQSLISNYAMTATYNKGELSVIVANDAKTANFLNSLLRDQEDTLNKYYYKNHEDITITFTAMWSVNKFNVNITIADENGRNAQYGSVEIDDRDDSTENRFVTTTYRQQVEYGKGVTFIATANAHSNFFGFYRDSANAYEADGTTILINGNRIGFESVTREYNLIVRFRSQKITLELDLTEHPEAAIVAGNFNLVETGRYQLTLSYFEIESRKLDFLPSIDRVGYETIALKVGATEIAKEMYSTTLISSFVESEFDDEIISFVPVYTSIGLVVILDYGYDGITKSIAVSYDAPYQDAEGWDEAPSRYGYQFVGWFDHNSNMIVGTSIVSYTQEHTLTAQWDINKSTILFTVLNGRIENSTLEFTKGGNLYIANDVEYLKEISFKLVANQGYVFEATWAPEFTTTTNADGSLQVVFVMTANDYVYTLPIVARINRVVTKGSFVEGVTAFDITIDEIPITVVDKAFDIETGKTIRLVATASRGYQMTDNVEFDSALGLIVDKTLSNGILIMQIVGIFQDLEITFEAEEQINRITIEFEDITKVERVMVGDLTYADPTQVDVVEIETAQILKLGIVYKHGYTYGFNETNEFETRAREISSNQCEIIVSEIYSSGNIKIYHARAKFTVTIEVLSYNQDRELVNEPGNIALADGENPLQVEYLSTITLTYETATLYSFAGWSEDGENVFGSANGQRYTITDNIRLYAIFSTMKFYVTFATYNYYQIYTEYNDPTKTEDVFEEVESKYYDEETSEQITSAEIYYGASKNILLEVQEGYKYAGYGFWKEDEFVFLTKTSVTDQLATVSLISSLFDEEVQEFTLYLLIEAYGSSFNFITEINIDGIRENNFNTAYINLSNADAEDVNRFGYVDGTRIHYSEEDFVDEELLDNKKFSVVAYTGDEVYIKLVIEKEGYVFDKIVSSRDDIAFDIYERTDDYIMFVFNEFIGGEDFDFEILIKPVLNTINLAFLNNDIRVDGGAFDIGLDENNAHKVWTSGNQMTYTQVSAYTDSRFVVYAYIRAGYYWKNDGTGIVDESGLIVEGSLEYEDLVIEQSGYTGRIKFEVADYIKENTISILVFTSLYSVRLVEDGQTLAIIKDVTFGSTLNLSEENTANITLVDDRLGFMGGKLRFDAMKRENHSFEGFFTYENGAGIRYINANGEAINSWAESGYILDTITSLYKLSTHAKVVNEETGEIEITLYLYWAYLKTRIEFNFVPEIDTKYTAKDMVSGVDFSNSWFYETSPHYIEVSFNTPIVISAPEFEGYKFYAFILSQRNHAGVWLQDVLIYTPQTPWSTNDVDRIVECQIKIIYYAHVEVLVSGGEANFKITQDNADAQSKALLLENYVDTEKTFTIEALPIGGYTFESWSVLHEDEDFEDQTITLQIDKEATLVINLSGRPATLWFEEYSPQFGQIVQVAAYSLNLSKATYEMGYYSNGTFEKTITQVLVNVGDTVEFKIKVDSGFAVYWNRAEITFGRYDKGFYYFEMKVGTAMADQIIEIIPTFDNTIVSLYVSSSFDPIDIVDKTLDQNNIAAAGSIKHNGRATKVVVMETGKEILLETATTKRYEIVSITIENYGKSFGDMYEFYDDDTNTILLTPEYMQENNIVGIINLAIVYSRMHWEDESIFITSFAGQGSEKNPYKIGSATELTLLMKLVNSGARNANGELYSRMHYELARNIDLSEKFWTPIGTILHPFEGVFNFNGHTVRGVQNAYVYKRVSYDGLFGEVSTASRLLSNKTASWYFYLIGLLGAALVVTVIVILVLTRKRRKRRRKLSNQ